MKKTLKVGSLFAGVGGICLGLQSAENLKNSFEITWGNEIDEYACETYRTNFPHTLIEGDINFVLDPSKVPVKIRELENRILDLNLEIKTLNDCLETSEIKNDVSKQITKYKTEISQSKALISKLKNQIDTSYYEKMHEIIISEKIDLLNGGFPCQAFSIAGEQKGFSDERGNLFLSIIELIKQLYEKHKEKPRFLLLENVKNLKSHDKGRTYTVIKKELEKTGYTIKEAILNTMDFTDLPQNRERIYIIGFLNIEDANKFDFFDRLSEFKIDKSFENRRSQIKAIIDINSIVDSKYLYNSIKYPHYFIDECDFVSKKKDDVRINLTESINEFYQFYQVRRGQYVRKNQSNVCPTLTANMGTGGHNVPLILTNHGIRKLTPSECFKLQGFPVGESYRHPTKYKGRSYSDANLYKQAGNAVSVPMIKIIAEQILKTL